MITKGVIRSSGSDLCRNRVAPQVELVSSEVALLRSCFGEFDGCPADDPCGD